MFQRKTKYKEDCLSEDANTYSEFEKNDNEDVHQQQVLSVHGNITIIVGYITSTGEAALYLQCKSITCLDCKYKPVLQRY